MDALTQELLDIAHRNQARRKEYEKLQAILAPLDPRLPENQGNPDVRAKMNMIADEILRLKVESERDKKRFLELSRFIEPAVN